MVAETDSEISHSDDIMRSASWTTSLRDTEAVRGETVSEGVYTFPQPRGTFKEYACHKDDLSRAVIPAAILAGYTGEESS